MKCVLRFDRLLMSAAWLISSPGPQFPHAPVCHSQAGRFTSSRLPGGISPLCKLRSSHRAVLGLIRRLVAHSTQLLPGKSIPNYVTPWASCVSFTPAFSLVRVLVGRRVSSAREHTKDVTNGNDGTDTRSRTASGGRSEGHRRPGSESLRRSTDTWHRNGHTATEKEDRT